MRLAAKIAFASALALSAPVSAADVILHPVAKMQLAPMPQNADVVAAKIRLRLTPRGAAWVRDEVRWLHDNKIAPSQVESDASNAGGGLIGGSIPPGGDIEELAFVVLMDATADADQDLQSIMADVKAQNAAKSQMREQMQTVNNAESAAASKQDQRDSTSDMSEMTSMRLQMAMDRRSKFVETLSNILKKIAGTDQSIIQNMK